MDEQFRTCMFGGFAKEDVVGFIAKQAEEYRDTKESLQSQVADLQKKNQELEEALRTLHSKTAAFQENYLNATELEAQVKELQEQLDALTEENTRLSNDARAYREVRDHIAEIEISAHRRTEEFRARAIENLRECIEQQKNWCNEQRARYEGVNEEAVQSLRHCEQIVQNSDYNAAFDRMLFRLQELSNGLDNE